MPESQFHNVDDAQSFASIVVSRLLARGWILVSFENKRNYLFLEVKQHDVLAKVTFGVTIPSDVSLSTCSPACWYANDTANVEACIELLLQERISELNRQIGELISERSDCERAIDATRGRNDRR